MTSLATIPKTTATVEQVRVEAVLTNWDSPLLALLSAAATPPKYRNNNDEAKKRVLRLTSSFERSSCYDASELETNKLHSGGGVIRFVVYRTVFNVILCLLSLGMAQCDGKT